MKRQGHTPEETIKKLRETAPYWLRLSVLKPGMNAKAEIIVDQLAKALYVTVQSIEVEADQHFCYIQNNGKLERRSIKTGV
jgi:hypothetical protein